MKRGYGKTYFGIFVVILIIIAAAYGVIYFLNHEYDNEKYETVKTDMLLIKAKIKIVSEKVNIKEEGAKYIGTKASEMKENEEIIFLEEKELIDLDKKENQYYVLNKENLGEIGLDTIELKEGFFVVDYKTEEIIYTKGVMNKEGNQIYKLSEMEDLKKE